MKMEWIKRIQELGTDGVMMIGDGLNDIPCLQEAAIGVSINAKSELNINAADVVVLDDNLYKILALIRMLKKGNLFININLFWAFSYNIVIMPIVAGVFYKWDFWVSPIWSSIAMSLSSIIVVSISHLLSFFKYDESLRPEKGENARRLNNDEGDLSSSANRVIKREKKSTPYVELI
jgi:Cu+-exporting ATPase